MLVVADLRWVGLLGVRLEDGAPMGAAGVPAPWRQVVGGAEVEHVALAVEGAVIAEVLPEGVVE